MWWSNGSSGEQVRVTKTVDKNKRGYFIYEYEISDEDSKDKNTLENNAEEVV